jgi:hypothetical protein
MRQVMTDDGAPPPVTRPSVPDGAGALPRAAAAASRSGSSAGWRAARSDRRAERLEGARGARLKDIIDGRFRILSIGTESLDIAYADGRGRQTLRLTGQ